MVFEHARRALDNEPGVTGDGGSKQLRQQRLGGTGFAHQHQTLLAHQRDDAAVNQRVVAEKLLGYAQLVVAEYEAPHRPGRQAPAPGTGAVVGRGQFLQLVGEPRLRGGALHIAHIHGIFFSQSSSKAAFAAMAR